MPVIRANRNENYTVMSNVHLKDKRMTLKAKGLLSVVLSLPPDWDYSFAGLVAICKESETAIKSAIKELKEFGYLTITKERDEKGHFDYVYVFNENPQTDLPLVENPVVENPPTDNPMVENVRQLNTNKSNTKELNTKELNTKDNIKENNKKKTPNESALIEKQLEEYANGDEELLMLLHEWLKCRKAKRLVATEFAIKTNLKKIDRMAKASNLTVKEYLEEVICRGWGAFYPINDFNNSYQRKNKIDSQPTKSEEPTKPTNPKDEIITEGTFKGWTVGKLEEERRKAGERYRAEMERRKKEQENNLC